MLVHMVHSEHMLNLLGMQSFAEGLLYRACHMVCIKTDSGLTAKIRTAKLCGAFSNEWG